MSFLSVVTLECMGNRNADRLLRLSSQISIPHQVKKRPLECRQKRGAKREHLHDIPCRGGSRNGKPADHVTPDITIDLGQLFIRVAECNRPNKSHDASRPWVL